MSSLNNYIYEMSKKSSINGWSDLHIQEGEVIKYRNSNGVIVKDDNSPFELVSDADINELVKSTLSEEDDFENFKLKKFLNEKNGDFDFSFSSFSKDKEDEKPQRFRCNLHFFNGRRVGLVMRKIEDEIIDIEKLGLPELARTFANKSAGLILVTGPTGSGKSTTLASIINEINKNRQEHIVTVEDPIEYIFEPIRCQITQREVGHGKDSLSFKNALRASLRQDPDIILVGEIRDAETATMALEASQTGHLVFGTLHTKSASDTINRFINMFPSSDRGNVSGALSDSLIGIISQILVPKIGGGKILACEVMEANLPIKTCIRDVDKIKQIKNEMITGQKITGMMLLNQYLIRLIQEDKITPEDAIAYCVDSVELVNELKKKNMRLNSHEDENLISNKNLNNPSIVNKIESNNIKTKEDESSTNIPPKKRSGVVNGMGFLKNKNK